MDNSSATRPEHATGFPWRQPVVARLARARAALTRDWGSTRFSVLMNLIWILALVIVYPLLETLRVSLPPGHLAVAVVGDVTFGAIVLWLVLWERWLVAPAPRRRWVALAALLVITLILMTNDPNPTQWLGMFCAVAGVAAWTLPSREAVRAIALSILTFLASAVVFAFDYRLTALFLLFLLLISVSMMNRRRLELTNRELRAAREELVQLAVAEERLRFARDLHDLLGHSLSMMVLKSELAGRLLPSAPDRAAVEIQDVERVAREALREVRAAVAGYRQPALASELAGAREMLVAAGITPAIVDDAGTLPGIADATLAWAVREGVTNVIRHSHARHCTIRVVRAGDTAAVEICDDGHGGAAYPGVPGQVGGSGLPGLAERMAMRGGRLDAGPRADGGFRLAVTVPVAGAVADSDVAVRR
jgi:two-component system sensor histidine kinase DesK